MITLEDDALHVRAPGVHDRARCVIAFERTLRIPDDGRDYPLPPGLGSFPLRHLDDYAARLPAAWRTRGGVITPMRQAEALWISFEAGLGAGEPYPFAVKIGTGKVCAVTGDRWVNHLNSDPQDYVVIPEQPWLDGYCVEEGIVRQFVAMPLGDGYTAEEQLTGAGSHGGLQILAYPMKAERYRSLPHPKLDGELHAMEAMGPDMGLAPGGRMRQEIYEDPYDLDTWDQRHPSRCFVSIVNTAQWMAVTGEVPPGRPFTAEQYTAYGLPWFDYYDGDAEALEGSARLRGMASVAQFGRASGKEPLPENVSAGTGHVVRLGKGEARPVREGAAGEIWA
ncbi:MAG: hypothetical protein OXI73_02590 [Rhodospirillales bacterium]|nr:hypothetical protein [Rhodospirillales bacterium]